MDEIRDDHGHSEDADESEKPDGIDLPSEREDSPVTGEEEIPTGQAGFPFEAPYAPVPPEEGLPVPETEADYAGSEAEREPPRAASYVAFAIVIMAVLGMFMTFAAVNMYFERADMMSVLEEATGVIEGVYGRTDAPDPARRRVALLKQSLDEGDYEQARRTLEALRRPDAGRPAFDTPKETVAAPEIDEALPGLQGETEDSSQLPDPTEVRELPAEARQFFAGDDEAWEAFIGFSAAIAQLEQAGANIGSLKRLRGRIVEAARLGQTDRVDSLMSEARQAVDEIGQGGLPDTLAEKIKRFQQAAERAQSERRDIRAAVRIARQSEEAARQGDFDRAEQLMESAVEALERAPRAQRAPGQPGAVRPDRPEEPGPAMAPEFAFTRFLAGLAGRVMQAEEEDLSQIHESINIAMGAIRERNTEQLREILNDARESLQSISERRREMTTTIEETQESIAQEAPRDMQEAEEAAARERERHQEVVLSRLSELVEQIRHLPEDEFEQHREEIAQRVIAAVTAPVEPVDAERKQVEMKPEERVREKMRIAGEIYAAIRRETDLDTEELDEHFAEVRELIAAQDYERAEEMVDEGVAMMQEMTGQMDSVSRPDGPQPERSEDIPSVDLDGVDIDLRGIMQDQTVTPPPAPDTTPEDAPVLPQDMDVTD